MFFIFLTEYINMLTTSAYDERAFKLKRFTRF